MRPDKFTFSCDRDSTGEFVKVEMVLRNTHQVDLAKTLIETMRQFVKPEIVIHPLAAWQYTESEETPIINYKLKLVA